jgi:hypothetical protein
LFAAGIPPLAEFRAAHADDCNFVFDARGHSGTQ